MKNNLHRFALLPLPLLLLCSARADFNPALVAADAQWVVSIDLNELRDSTLGKELIALAEKHMEAATAQMGQPAGLDFGGVRINFQKTFEMIGSVTAYGTNFAPDPKLIDGALIIQGTPDLSKIAEALVLQASTLSLPDKVTEVKDLPFAAYSIAGEVFIAFPPEPVVLISKSRAQLLKAREVVRGAAPSLTQSRSPLAGLVAKSGRAYFVAGSVAPTDQLFAVSPDAPQARILQLAKSGMVSIGELDTKTVATVQLAASSDDTADKLLKIVQGMVAMMSLAESSDKDLAAFLQSAVVDKQDRTVRVQLSYSSDRLVLMLKNVQQQMNPQPVAARPPGPAAPPATPGKVVGEWMADLAPAGAVPSADLLTDHAVQNVRLVNGATISLTSRRDLSGQRDAGRAGNPGVVPILDYVEIVPASGTGSALHFEAENMRLQGYRAQAAPYASRGRLAGLRGSFGSAQFDFPGEDGSYEIRVRYMEQSSGKTTMGVTVKDPDPIPAVMPALPAGK